MIYGFSKTNSKAFFTHVVYEKPEQLTELKKGGHCFDDNILFWASFTHLSESEHQDWIKNNNIQLVDSKKELQFLHQLLKDHKK